MGIKILLNYLNFKCQFYELSQICDNITDILQLLFIFPLVSLRCSILIISKNETDSINYEESLNLF